MILLPEDLLKLLLAVLVGGLIGLEREFRDKAAGFRTIILICIETRIESARDARTYEVVFPNDRKTSKELEDLALEIGLKITGQSRTKSGGEMILSLNVTGSTEQHERFSDKLLAHAEVKQFKV